QHFHADPPVFSCSKSEQKQLNTWVSFRSAATPGVYEIKIRAKQGAFRVFYVANRAGVISVLHAFQKTTRKTEKRDIDLAKTRLKSQG
ncbi:type II toxin-antitoxin system RelE/ParE family toxin, partial [Pseudomonas savastanoi]